MQLTITECHTAVAVKSVTFRPPGGTIGRSQDNDLVLPDESRAISRLHALLHLSASGECRLTSQGSVAPVIHNGTALPRGGQVSLQDGDRLQIGEYLIAVGTPLDKADPLTLFVSETPESDDPLGLLDPVAAELQAPVSSASASARHTNARLAIEPEENIWPALSGNEGQEQDRLVNALLEGMGLNNGHATFFDEQQMRMTGRMLSLFSQGTVALLSSRQILKRGVKADMTVILNEANNPFKILPSGKTVLMQIYQSQMPGFMSPEQAVRDALVDLQAHQLGMIAGIRAIIAAMLQSFNPQRLEEQARKDGALPTLPFATARKAALWDYFVRNYQHTAGEIEDDFHTLFGEAFLHAYDVEVNQYKDSQMRTDET